MKSRVVLLTRGHGFGHAARDLHIINSIRATRPDIDLTVASSGTGLEFFRLNGLPCHDLGIPDAEDTTPSAGKKVMQYLTGMPRPDFVITDEVVWALPICQKLLGVGSVYLTDWFYRDLGRPHLDKTLNLTSAIVVPDFPEAHPELTDITVPLHFPGPLVRRLPRDRDAARAQFGVPEDVFLAVVSLGGMSRRPEAQRDIDAVARAWRHGAAAEDRLFVYAERDPSSEAQREVSATWVELTPSPRLFSAADVVVVDGAGFTACELARSGTPTLAIRTPWMNLAGVARLGVLESAGLISVVDTGAEPAQLWETLRDAASRSPIDGDQLRWADPDDVAATILRYMN